MIQIIESLPFWAFILAGVIVGGKVTRWLLAEYFSVPGSEHQTVVSVSQPENDIETSEPGARNWLIKHLSLRPHSEKVVDVWQELDACCGETEDENTGVRRFFYLVKSKAIEE